MVYFYRLEVIIFMNRKIVISALSALTALGMMGAATFAYFNDTNTSTGNTFSSGTLDLQLANGVSSFTQNVTASFGGTDMSPGVCLAPATLWIKNIGPVIGNHVDFTATNTLTSFAAFLKLNTLTFDGLDVSLADSNGNTIRDLQDLAINGIPNKAVTDLIAHPLIMEVCLDSSAGNPQQGQSNTLDLTVFLDQGSHI